MEIHFAEKSDQGMSRSENQDACGHFEGALGRLYVVCDGMGGHAGGQIASTLAVQTIGEGFESALAGEPCALLRGLVKEANKRVYQHAQGDPALTGMGTTVVMLLVDPAGESAWWANVGDSRLYRVRDERLEQLSCDHTVVQRLIEQDKLRESQASLHPQAGVLSRSLGVEAEVEVDVSCERAPLRSGDLFLLCSDGLTTMMADEDIERFMLSQPLSKLPRELVNIANLRGGYDNITVQVVGAGELPEVKPRSQPAAEPELEPRGANLPWGLMLGGAIVILLLVIFFMAR